MFQTPDWVLPNNVKAIFTDRIGGVSKAPYSEFNLATHVDDDSLAVSQNRQLLKSKANLPSEPFWLNQQHTNTVITAHKTTLEVTPPIADASWSNQPGQVLSVMTADCMPILLSTIQGDKVAAIHAGWRGLQQGIISKTIKEMQVQSKDITAWIGPAISQENFEVGEEVKLAFEEVNVEFAQAFKPNTIQLNKFQTNTSDDSQKTPAKFLADLPAIAEMEMKNLGVHNITQSGLCTYADEKQFYSYRRDGQTGRMAAIIWIE